MDQSVDRVEVRLPGSQWLRQGRAEGRGRNRRRPLHPLPASQVFRGELNYGDGLVPLDKLFGTFHDGSDEAEEAMNRRVRERQKA